MNGWVGGWVDGWVDGWVGGWVVTYLQGQVFYLVALNVEFGQGRSEEEEEGGWEGGEVVVSEEELGESVGFGSGWVGGLVEEEEVV